MVSCDCSSIFMLPNVVYCRGYSMFSKSVLSLPLVLLLLMLADSMALVVLILANFHS
jgi:hypothetical protein